MHAEAYQWVAEHVPSRRRRVVEFGSLNINGTVRGLFTGSDYWGVDVQPGPGVDEVADAATWTSDRPVDVVVCCEVLEHAPDGRGVVAAAGRVLRPGGVLLVTCATDPRAPHSGVDGGAVREGEWYRNVDPDVLAGWLAAAGFTGVLCEVHRDRGDLYVIAQKEPFHGEGGSRQRS